MLILIINWHFLFICSQTLNSQPFMQSNFCRHFVIGWRCATYVCNIFRNFLKLNHCILLSAPDYHNCTNITVPNNMYCYEDPSSGHVLDCPRSCPLDCMDMQTDPICSSDLGTYEGSCDMQMKTCESYAREFLDQGNLTEAADVLRNITVASDKSCPSK